MDYRETFVLKPISDYTELEEMPRFYNDPSLYAELPLEIRTVFPLMVVISKTSIFPSKAVFDALGMYFIVQYNQISSSDPNDHICIDLSQASQLITFENGINSTESDIPDHLASVKAQSFIIVYGTELSQKQRFYGVAKSAEMYKKIVFWLNLLVNNRRLTNPSLELLITREYYRLKALDIIVGKTNAKELLKSMKCGKNSIVVTNVLTKLNLIDKDQNIVWKKLTITEFFNFFAILSESMMKHIRVHLINESKVPFSYDSLSLFLEGCQNCEGLLPYCDDLESIFFSVEKNAASRSLGILSNSGFVNYFFSEYCSAINPLYHKGMQDMDQPLSHYFINSSHNTYLNGRQVNGTSSVEMYRYVLLTGCRCVEIDAWDGSNNEPIVTHGKAMCTDISLKDTLMAIKDTAFVVSDYPVILSIENHLNYNQQKVMADQMIEIFGDMLLSEPLPDYPLEAGVYFPSPEKLKGKILIKNKKLNPEDEKSACQELLSNKDDLSHSNLNNITQPRKNSFANDDMALNNSLPIEDFPKKKTISEGVNTKAYIQEDNQKLKDTYNYGKNKASNDPKKLTGKKTVVSRPETNIEKYKPPKDFEEPIPDTIKKNKSIYSKFNHIYGKMEMGKFSFFSSKQKPASSNDVGSNKDYPTIKITENTNQSAVEIDRNHSCPSTVLTLNQNSTKVSQISPPFRGRTTSYLNNAFKAVSSHNPAKNDLDLSNNNLDSDEDDEEAYFKDTKRDESGQTKVIIRHIHPHLSRLVNYIKPTRLIDLSKKNDDEFFLRVSSISETGCSKVIKGYGKEVCKYTKNNLIRVYPRGNRVDSSNYNPQVYWDCGIQLIALNFQTPDINYQLNSALFEINNRCGYVLKPHYLLNNSIYDPHGGPIHDNMISCRIRLTVFGGLFVTDSYKPDLCCTVETFGRYVQNISAKIRSITQNDDKFIVIFDTEKISFDCILNCPYGFVRFAVMERNTCHGQRFINIRNIKKGYRYITLRSMTDQQLPLSALFVHIHIMKIQKKNLSKIQSFFNPS